MRSVNLYLLTRNKDKHFYTEYENVLSARSEPLKVKEHEFDNLIRLVEMLCEHGAGVRELEGFYYSYTIRQIGKEFDLLKIHCNHTVLNIELKSQAVTEEKIEKQLLKNKYYLSSIARELYLFTFVDETGELYRLEGEALRLCTIEELLRVMRNFSAFETGDIDTFFSAKDYLISPLNMPKKFVENRYFLTQQQEMIKHEILCEIAGEGRFLSWENAGTSGEGRFLNWENTGTEEERKGLYWGITGMAGTGKTLLLYDLAKACSAYGTCCIVHCGMLSEGHMMLNGMLEEISIIDAMALSSVEWSTYRFLFVDEAQRMTTEILKEIVEVTQNYDIPAVFSYDYFQTLSKTEQRRNIPGKLKELNCFQERKLSGRIRSNEEMSSFIRILLDLNDVSGKRYRYDAVDVVFAADRKEAENIILYYCNEKEYTYIEYETSKERTLLSNVCRRGYCTENAIGQEFEQVIITLDDKFYYNEEGRLQGKNHPNPDYIYDRLFFQGVSRTREKLCIVVIGNETLFENIVSIKYKSIGLE